MQRYKSPQGGDQSCNTPITHQRLLPSQTGCFERKNHGLFDAFDLAVSLWYLWLLLRLSIEGSNQSRSALNVTNLISAVFFNCFFVAYNLSPNCLDLSSHPTNSHGFPRFIPLTSPIKKSFPPPNCTVYSITSKAWSGIQIKIGRKAHQMFAFSEW